MRQDSTLHPFLCGICSTLVFVLLLPLSASADCASPPPALFQALPETSEEYRQQLVLESEAIAFVLFELPCGDDAPRYRLHSPILNSGDRVMGIEEVSGRDFTLTVEELSVGIGNHVVFNSFVGELSAQDRSIHVAGLSVSLVDGEGVWRHSLLPLYRLGEKVMNQSPLDDLPMTHSAGFGHTASRWSTNDPIHPPRDEVVDPASPATTDYSSEIPAVAHQVRCFCANGFPAEWDQAWQDDIEDAYLAKERDLAIASDRLDICVGGKLILLAAILGACLGALTIISGGTLTLPGVLVCAAADVATGLLLQIHECFLSYFGDRAAAKRAYDAALKQACVDLKRRGGCNES